VLPTPTTYVIDIHRRKIGALIEPGFSSRRTCADFGRLPPALGSHPIDDDGIDSIADRHWTVSSTLPTPAICRVRKTARDE
jgi:hypothetical protein